MNIEEAKQLPVSRILKALGHEPVYTTDDGDFYLSLFKAEETPGLRVKDNLWLDVITGEEGDSTDLVRKHLKHSERDHTDFDVLNWINFMFGYVNPLSAIPKIVAGSDSDQKSIYKLRQTKTIEHPGLIRYIENRGIDLAIARQVLVELNLVNRKTQHAFCALGLLNKSKGYEFISPRLKGHTGKRSFTLIRRKDAVLKDVHLFLDRFDYLTFLMMPEGQSRSADIIILNSYRFLEEASVYIRGFGYQTASTWFRNSKTGDYCTKLFGEFCKLEAGLIHQARNPVYKGHDSLNAWHMHEITRDHSAGKE